MSRLKVIWQSLNPERVNSIRVITLSVGAAATFWFLNALNDSYSTTINYPVQFEYDKAKYIAIAELPDEIQINVNGLGWNLFRNNLGIRTTPIIFRLDNPIEIKKLPANTMLGTVSDQMDEFQVNFVLTDTVFINIDNKVSQRYKLAIDSLSIRLEDNHWMTTPISYSPDSVTLLGPQSILESFNDTLTVRVPSKNIDDNYSEDIPIEVKQSQFISRNPPTVSVSFNVEEFRTGSMDVIISQLNFPEDSAAFLSKLSVKLNYHISRQKETEVSNDQFELVADYEKFNQTDSSIVLELIQFPEYIRNVSIDSAGLKVLFNESR